MPTERYPTRRAEGVTRDWTDDHGVGYGRPGLARAFGDLHAWGDAIVLQQHEFAEAVDKYGQPE